MLKKGIKNCFLFISNTYISSSMQLNLSKKPHNLLLVNLKNLCLEVEEIIISRVHLLCIVLEAFEKITTLVH